MNRLRSIFCIIAFCATSIVALAQENSLLWEITGNGLKKTSFLFGTIHMICKKDYVWTPAMQKSFAACNTVCFEMDLDDNAAMADAASGLMDNSGKKLSSYFTDAEYKKLRRFMKDTVGIDIVLLQQMKPIALESLIGLNVTGCKDASSYEETIMGLAQKRKMTVEGLEAPSEQIDVLESIPVDSVVSGLLQEIESFPTYKADYRRMVAAYQSQDIGLLHTLVTELNDMSANMAVFLDDRNKRWIPRMTEKMKKNSVFFAVGGGHLAGDAGVIAELRKAGYTVKAVR